MNIPEFVEDVVVPVLNLHAIPGPKPDEPELPELPEEPDEPSEPLEPEVPEEPSEPLEPLEPEVPEEPSEPLDPEEPLVPDVPEEPLVPDEPSEPLVPEDAAFSLVPTSPLLLITSVVFSDPWVERPVNFKSFNSALEPLIITFFQFGISILLGWLLIIQTTSLTGRNICYKY